MSTPDEVTTLALPATFQAQMLYRAGIAIGALVSVAVLGLVVARPTQFPLGLIILYAIVFVALLLYVWTFRLDISDTGVTQSSLLGRKSVAWAVVARVDQAGRGFYLYDDAGKLLAMLALLSPTAQQAIGDEAIKRAGLRPSREKLTHPTTARWTR